MLMQSLLQFDPAQRCTWDQFFRNPFLAMNTTDLVAAPTNDVLEIGEYICTTRQLGRGAYAPVYYGYHKTHETPVAIKRIDLGELIRKNPRNGVQQLKNEVRIMQMANHPNIVRLYNVKQVCAAMLMVGWLVGCTDCMGLGWLVDIGQQCTSFLHGDGAL
jgi:hypothetical protein